MSSRRCWLVLLAGCVLSSLLLYYLARWGDDRHLAWWFGRGNVSYVTYFPHRAWRNQSTKTILLWTTRFGRPFWALAGYETFKSCKVSACEFITDHNRINDSDALLFHPKDKDLLIEPLPTHHPDHQVWVLVNHEPLFRLDLDFSRYDGVFNWTAMYRRDADVYSPYGGLMRRDKPFQSWETETDPDLLSLGRTPHNVSGFPPSLAASKKLALTDFHAQKTKLVAWVSSNCVDQSRRRRVVNQLSRHLPIDMYGDCGNLTLGKSEQDSVLTNYRFFLSFESSLCRDYVTEKFWAALGQNQIPVVFGAADYSQVAPPNSFMDVRDFRSVRDLADYMKEVDSNPSLYNQHLWWTQYYRAVSDYQLFMTCELCRVLHDGRRPAKTYTDLQGWLSNDTCSMHSMFDTVSRTVEGHLLRKDIIP
ncbi:alpha-(1,3)-fucosyltransferase C [Aplysia californica]|uniref:Fucosyltransferase n=1 Tax=Aplysia californica TaxID=6500 RepID=A0ABM1VS30_APLCA|nr:alpha-(1,3)-fucosyltransferase C [Aplysia californica]